MHESACISGTDNCMAGQSSKSFVIVDDLHINLVNDDNPMIAPGNQCHFIFSNVDDIHRCLIGQGTIADQQYLDGLNQQYIIRLDFVCEPEEVKKRFFYDKVFRLSQMSSNGGFTDGRFTVMRYGEHDSICRKMFFRVDAFFVRPNFERAQELRLEYTRYIRSQLLKQLSDVEELLVE